MDNNRTYSWCEEKKNFSFMLLFDVIPTEFVNIAFGMVSHFKEID